MRRTGPEARRPPGRPANSRKAMSRVVLGVGVVCVVVLVLALTGWGASLWEVFSDRGRLQRVLEGAGALAPLLFLVLLVVQAVVAPLPAPALAIVGGYGFGVLEGFFLTWLGSLIGGLISFALSRRFGRGSSPAARGPCGWTVLWRSTARYLSSCCA
jgi:uncharacterized membrane protein YdjX (TVP38/TMEM64 family)